MPNKNTHPSERDFISFLRFCADRLTTGASTQEVWQEYMSRTPSPAKEKAPASVGALNQGKPYQNQPTILERTIEL